MVVQDTVIKIMQEKITESVICFNEFALIYHQFDYIPITEEEVYSTRKKTQ